MDSNNSLFHKHVKKIIHKFHTNDPSRVAKESNIKIKHLDNATDLLGMYTVIARNRFIFLNSNTKEYLKRKLKEQIQSKENVYKDYQKQKEKASQLNFLKSNLKTYMQWQEPEINQKREH